MVTWFAGLFYIVRLFIYHVEACNRPGQAQGEVLIEQFLIMERRLWYGITWPSCVLTLVFGAALAHHFLPLTEHPWLLNKLIMVAGLFLYHLSCGHLYRHLRAGKCSYTSTQLRLWNELATVFLFAIVFLAVLKDSLPLPILLWGVSGLAILFMGGIILYRHLAARP